MAKADPTKWSPKRDMPVLKALVDATRAGTFIYADPEKMQAHKALDYVEFNLTMPNPENAAEFAARATAQALQEVPDPNATADNSNKDTETMSETTAPASGLENNVGSEAVAQTTSRAPRNPIRVANVVKGMGALPSLAKGPARGRKSAYDFGSLAGPTLDEQGNVTAAAYLFIPNLDGRDDMLKLVSANVAAYNTKVKDVIDPVTNRKAVFKAYNAEQPIEEGGEPVKGVSIYRVS